MSHTPGPWFVAPDDADDCPDHKDSGLYLVDTGRIGDWPLARLCELNNAQAIAVLPELLEAMKEVLRISHRKHDAWDRAYAAIAKAEGRT